MTTEIIILFNYFDVFFNHPMESVSSHLLSSLECAIMQLLSIVLSSPMKECDQEMLQTQTTEHPMIPRERDI